MASKKEDHGGNGGAPENSDGPADKGNGETPPLTVIAQYTKDLSFEAPATPGIFERMQAHNPEITINIDVNVQPVEEKKVYEVVLNSRAECKVEDTIAFLLELSYGGVFNVNVPDEHLQPLLLIECPRLLFPFARNIMADTTRDGGFPPLMLGPVDFVAMFQAQVAQQQAQQAGQGSAPVN